MPWHNTLAKQHASRVKALLWRKKHKLHSAQQTRVVREGEPRINFCSNDYLGLANHPKVRQAAKSAIDHWGVGSGASAMVCGYSQLHEELQNRLADHVRAERALLFSTGYMANLAVVQTFLGKQDLLFSDELNHASLIDGARLSGAGKQIYRHLDMQHLRDRLQSANSSSSVDSNGRKLILSDTVFSMDGDKADLTSLATIANEHQALLYLDDAHGFGVLGPGGAGALAEAGMDPSGNRLMLGTLGKALGTFGAFVAGDAPFIDELEQRARPHIYTTALPANLCGATLEALNLVEQEDWRRQHLNALIRRFKQNVSQMGLKLMPSDTPIQPILLGNEADALQASNHLNNRGIWVSAIRPPTVPEGSCRLRIALSAEHSFAQLDQLLDALSGLPICTPENQQRSASL